MGLLIWLPWPAGELEGTAFAWHDLECRWNHLWQPSCAAHISFVHSGAAYWRPFLFSFSFPVSSSLSSPNAASWPLWLSSYFLISSSRSPFLNPNFPPNSPKAPQCALSLSQTLFSCPPHSLYYSHFLCFFQSLSSQHWVHQNKKWVFLYYCAPRLPP